MGLPVFEFVNKVFVIHFSHISYNFSRYTLILVENSCLISFYFNDTGGCFASNSIVRVKTGSRDTQVLTKTLGELNVGDFVESYDPSTDSAIYSEVYFIAHQETFTNFTRLLKLIYSFSNGTESSIRLHAKHLVYACVNNSAVDSGKRTCVRPPLYPVTAESVEVGDVLWVRNASGKFSPTSIVEIREIRYSVRNPVTLNHHIVVDGVLSSVYVYNERLYRLVTTPLRVLYRINPEINNTWLVNKLVIMWDVVENYLL